MAFKFYSPGNKYEAQTGVTIRTITDAEGNVTSLSASNNNSVYFACKIDKYDNICDESGKVVYPSGAGETVLAKGDAGIF